MGYTELELMWAANDDPANGVDEPEACARVRSTRFTCETLTDKAGMTRHGRRHRSSVTQEKIEGS